MMQINEPSSISAVGSTIAEGAIMAGQIAFCQLSVETLVRLMLSPIATKYNHWQASLRFYR